MTSPTFRWLVIAATLAGLAACGGGGSSSTTSSAAATASSAKDVASGTVTGFGSVIVEGVKYDDDQAKVTLEHDASAPKSGSLADVKLGMQVEIQASASGQASTVVVSSEVIGTIASKTSDGFVVAGQTVKVSSDASTPTVFEGAAGLADLAVNDRVEVPGQRDSSNAILASRIERKDPSSALIIRVAGSVSNLDASAKSFSLAGLTVNFSAASRIVPANATLANGQRVAVWSDTAPAGVALTAKSIVVKSTAPNNNDLLRIGGRIATLNFAAKTFKLDGFDVDASAATFLNGSVNDLANGRKIRVMGKFVAGKVAATDLKFVRDQGDATVELSGAISDFVSVASFKVRGVPIDAADGAVVLNAPTPTTPTVQFVGGSAANLANGVAVHIVGQVANDVVKPSRIDFANGEVPGLRTFFGVVSSYMAPDGTFKLLGLSMNLSNATRFKNSDGSAATRADFGDQDLIKVKGTWVSGVLNVVEVLFQKGPSLVINQTEGGVYDFNVSNNTFKLNGMVVTMDGTTTFEGVRENLRNGVTVEVSGTIVEGKLVARKIEIKRPDGSDVSSVRGEISSFVSIAEFRVANQRVDASAASFGNGTAANLSNGSLVEIKGPVLDGVLKAAIVTLKN